LAWRESDFVDAARFGSRLSAARVARLRRVDVALGLRSACPTSYARSAAWRVRSDARPFFGAFSGTGAARLRQADSDCLFRRACAVFSLSHMLNFFTPEFAGSRRRAFAPAQICSGSLDRFPLRHGPLPMTAATKQEQFAYSIVPPNY
jgi:hypothetical protein